MCQKNLLNPDSIYKQSIDGLDIYSFYRYSEISTLIKSKYAVYGSRVLRILARNSLAYFPIPKSAYLIPIDDKVKNYFSHTAVLVKAMNHQAIFGSLRASKDIQYAGKSLTFRKENPREFIYTSKKDIDVVLIDDVVTYGITLSEAKRVLSRSGVNVLFAITLAKSID
jgi:competence protein ComFC